MRVPVPRTGNRLVKIRFEHGPVREAGEKVVTAQERGPAVMPPCGVPQQSDDKRGNAGENQEIHFQIPGCQRGENSHPRGGSRVSRQGKSDGWEQC